ncbi:hypothetical protein JW758_03620 [Candidatus Peregrinibacteria bacterium]|nr:hypothetical protein [Candidatus Peregrinibacteria bacterium]
MENEHNYSGEPEVYEVDFDATGGADDCAHLPNLNGIKAENADTAFGKEFLTFVTDSIESFRDDLWTIINGSYVCNAKLEDGTQIGITINNGNLVFSNTDIQMPITDYSIFLSKERFVQTIANETGINITGVSGEKSDTVNRWSTIPEPYVDDEETE